MSDSLALLSPKPPAEALARAVIRVDRAQTELKHGRAVVLVPDGTEAPLLLVAAVETLSAQRLRDLAGWGGELRLLLTAERLRALHWPEASTPRAMLYPAGATLETIQHLGAVGADVVDPQALRDPQPATSTMLAALTLAKRTRLTPALLVVELPPSQRVRLAAEEVLELPEVDVDAVTAVPGTLRLRRVSDARVPILAHEDCTLVLFREVDGSTEHVAILFGQPDRSRPVPVRLHSSCLTGDLLGSLRCDCGDQLRDAVEQLAQAGGVLLYLSQEGRGTGLANKLRAYRLQDGGLDTIDADRHLGFRDDERDFQAAVAMLQALDIRSINLLTNNPRKIDSMRRGGIEVVDRVALVAPVNTHNARYIRTKRERAGHLGAEAAGGNAA